MERLGPGGDSRDGGGHEEVNYTNRDHCGGYRALQLRTAETRTVATRKRPSLALIQPYLRNRVPGDRTTAIQLELGRYTGKGCQTKLNLIKTRAGGTSGKQRPN